MRTKRYSTLGNLTAFTAAFVGFLFAAVCATAGTYSTADGSSVDGDIQFTTSGSVFVLTGADAVTRLKKKELTADSLGAVQAWEASNTSNAGLSTKFDNKPQPVKIKNPERSGDIQALKGIVMLAVIVDESGAVAQAFVKDSSDARFNSASIEAMRNWEFSPLTRDAQPTRGLMFVPLQY